MALLEKLFAAFPVVPECSVHAHCPEERGELFHAFDAGSAEVEVVNFLNALVFLLKPTLCLETGTGHGFTTIAIAEGLRMNGFGHLHTVELDANTVAIARENLRKVDPELEGFVTFHCASSMEFLASCEENFDFALFDSVIAFRHKEFALMLQRDLLAPGALCCFHDTSRLRGRTMNDFNPEMIGTLDKHFEGRQWFESELSRGLRFVRA